MTSFPKTSSHSEVLSYVTQVQAQGALLISTIQRALDTHVRKLKCKPFSYLSDSSTPERVKPEEDQTGVRSCKDCHTGNQVDWLEQEKSKFRRILESVKHVVEMWREVPDHQRKEAEIHIARGKRRIQKGLHEDAIEACSKGLALNPSESMAYNNRGYSYQCLGRIQSALADYDRCLILDPNNKNALNNKGLLYFNVLKKYQESIVYYTKSLQSCPYYAVALQNRSLAFYKLEKYEQALTDLNKSIQIDPKRQKYKWRADVHLKLGKADEAQKDRVLADTLKE